MTADPLLQAVRRQLTLGRLVPLGGAADGAWLAERAAGSVVRRAVAEAALDVRLREVRLSRASAGGEGDGAPPAAVVPPPPSALPPGPLRIEATCAAGMDRPLPECVRDLRATLAAAARERIGLDVVAVDVHVAELLEDVAHAGEDADAANAHPAADTDADTDADDGDAEEQEAAEPGGREAVAAAVLAVPGVVRLSGALGGGPRTPQLVDTPPSRLVRLQLAVAPDRRTLTVVREARAAAAAAARDGAPGPVTVIALVTDVSTA